MYFRDCYFSKEMTLLNPGDTLEKAVKALKDTRYDIIPIVNDKKELIGVFTRTNLYNALLNKASLNDIIDPWIIKVVFNLQEDMPIKTIEEITKNNRVGVGSAPVIDKNGKVIGEFTKTNMILNLFEKSDLLETQLTAIQDVLHNEIVTFDNPGSISPDNKSIEKIFELGNRKINIVSDGIVVVNERGHVTLINQILADFLKIKPEDVLNKHIKEIMINSRLHIVSRTGVPEFSEIQNIGDKQYLVSRLPIIKDGVPSGAIGKVVFPQLPDTHELLRKITALQSKPVAFNKKDLPDLKFKVKTNEIIGLSPIILNLKEEIRKVSRTNSTVLITGESGSGKELVAQAIHLESERSTGPFIKINCAAIPDNLLESEIFGYASGAFSGANRNGKPGRFELADNGTLFLDEIGDMSCGLQAKLLRVIQEKEFERVGGIKTISVDVRIVTATNKDLLKSIDDGTFREDLYYRLNVINLHVPPLRERKNDIELLCINFIEQLNQELKTKITHISPEVIDIFINYSWPGNIRELKNVLERAANYAIKGEILPIHLPPSLLTFKETTMLAHFQNKYTYQDIVRNTQREIIIKALENAGGNKSKAAKLLNMSRTSLYTALQKLKIE
jgi:transcriptional regulator with PAS, ATPase and Fis domain